ncbi:TPA: asparagine synthase-related protein [Vibrio vulnificus]
MPGIYGFKKSGALFSTRLTEVAGTMKLYDHFIQDDLYEDESIAASRVHLGKIGEKVSPVTLGGLKIWVEGEAYNHKEVAASLGLQRLGLADLLLEAHATNKLDTFLNNLDGYFCAALYDKDMQQIKLISDRYGMRMLYWYTKDGAFAWGSEVKAILACEGVDKTIDPTSYECFMDLGYLLGEHTWFEQIKLIKPATVLTYDLKTQKIEQHYYWTWAEVKPCDLTFDQAVDELGLRFINAVERRFNPKENVGIALSGGLDSRAIFAAVEHLYPDFKGYAYTFGTPGCDDITIAEQVIKRSNWSHQNFHFSEQNWFYPRLEKVWNTDGMQDMMHMHGGEFIDEIATNMTVNLNGYSGDAIFGGGFLSRIPLNKRIKIDNAKKIYKDFSQLANIDDPFYDISKAEPNLQMNRVRRFTAMGTVNTLIACEQRKPFFDNSCVELIFSIPDEYRINNKLYSAMLQKYFPKYFRDIPWQKTGKPAGTLGKSSISKRAFNKILRHLKSAVGIQATKDYTDYNNWLRSPEISQYLTKLLDPKTALYPSITNQDFLVDYLTYHLNNKLIDKSNQILRAATMEIYLRQVYGKELPTGQSHGHP